MSMPPQTDLLDGMIARLEEANTRAYEQLARTDEGLSKPEQEDFTRHPSDRHAHVAAPKRQSSRTRPLFLVLIGLVLAGSACVAVFASEPSYGNAVKLILARWANVWDLQTEPEARATSQDGAPAAPLSDPQTERQIQRMADDLAKVEQRIEQLTASQDQIIRNHAAVAEQIKTSREQMARENAKVVEQFDAVLAQKDRHDAALAEQLKATQEQLAEVAAAQTASSRKPFRRKPRSTLPSSQKRAQARSAVR
jgi:hypothetical protein